MHSLEIAPVEYRSTHITFNGMLVPMDKTGTTSWEKKDSLALN